MTVISEGCDYAGYPVEIRSKDGLFYLICRSFNIVESDISIDKAFIKMVSKRKQISQELSSLGVKSVPTVNRSSFSDSSSELQKWMQISIIFMCLGLPIGLVSGAYFVAHKTKNIISNTRNALMHKVTSVANEPGQLVYMLGLISSKLDSVTPERKEEIQLEIRKIVTFMKPYVLELQEISDAKR